MKFSWKGELYKYTYFPNGLAFCPRKFTKLLKPVFATLRQKGDIVSGYIDDTFLVGDSVEDCWNNVLDTVNMFQSLGFVIHPDKSVFEPTQKVFLGFIIDSKNMTVSLTDEKARKLVNLWQKVYRKNKIKIRTVAQLLCNMTAAFPGVMYAQLYYRITEVEKSKSLKLSKENYDSKMICIRKGKMWSSLVDTQHSYFI